MARNIFVLYLEWYFVDAPKGIFNAWKGFLKFNFNYWSIVLLLKTLFSHWRRYHYSYGRGFDIGRYFEAFTFNVISRTIGFLMRTILITFGLAAEILVLLAGAAVFLFWLFLPLLLILGFFYGFKLLF